MFSFQKYLFALPKKMMENSEVMIDISKASD